MQKGGKRRVVKGRKWTWSFVLKIEQMIGERERERGGASKRIRRRK
jgi:hypothetical protein